MILKEKIIADWNKGSDKWFADIDFKDVFKIIKNDPYKGFPHKVSEIIKTNLPDLKGLNVCVPSCGDSIAAFSFALLGANVTATDISYKQIENAKIISKNEKINVDFFVCDSMEMDLFSDEIFDIVYTSNGVHVWIDDLCKMYSNFHRILKQNASYILFDTHPFNRPIKKYDSSGLFKLTKPYEDIGPHGEVPNFHWRIQDYVNALSDSGFLIRKMEEFHSIIDDIPAFNYLFDEEDKDMHNFDWKINPQAGLPQCIGFYCKKRCSK